LSFFRLGCWVVQWAVAQEADELVLISISLMHVLLVAFVQIEQLLSEDSSGDVDRVLVLWLLSRNFIVAIAVKLVDIVLIVVGVGEGVVRALNFLCRLFWFLLGFCSFLFFGKLAECVKDRLIRNCDVDETFLYGNFAIQS
jgi:hypothetical protein